jgi:hypothetical protein
VWPEFAEDRGGANEQRADPMLVAIVPLRRYARMLVTVRGQLNDKTFELR